LMQETADKVQAALTKDPLHPEQVAARLGIQYVKADNVAPGSPLPEVGVNKEFEESIASLKQGEVSQPVVVTGNKIALAVCTRITPAHPAAFDEVEDKVRDGFLNLKASQLVDQKANELSDKAKKDGGDLAAAAKSLGLEVKTSEAVDRSGAIEGIGSASMIPDAFKSAAGAIFGPVGVPNGRLVGKVLEKIPADMTGLAAQAATIRNELRNRKENARNALFDEGVKEALQKEGKIKIHQDVLNRLLASYLRT